LSRGVDANDCVVADEMVDAGIVGIWRARGVLAIRGMKGAITDRLFARVRDDKISVTGLNLLPPHRDHLAVQRKGGLPCADKARGVVASTCGSDRNCCNRDADDQKQQTDTEFRETGNHCGSDLAGRGFCTTGPSVEPGNHSSIARVRLWRSRFAIRRQTCSDRFLSHRRSISEMNRGCSFESQPRFHWF
jgi:hypothetical protein